jgi:hypothetical protein
MTAVKPSAIGAVDLELEGVAYRLRPSFAAIAEIETGTGASLFDLVRQIEAGGLSLDHVGIIVAATIRAEAKVNRDTALATIKPARAAELVYAEDGGLLLAVRAAIHPLLFNALTGGYTALGERKAQPPKPTTK